MEVCLAVSLGEVAAYSPSRRGIEDVEILARRRFNMGKRRRGVI